jgi:hypothetical protein
MEQYNCGDHPYGDVESSSGTNSLYSTDTHDSDLFANIVQKAVVSSQSSICSHNKLIPNPNILCDNIDLKRNVFSMDNYMLASLELELEN